MHCGLKSITTSTLSSVGHAVAASVVLSLSGLTPLTANAMGLSYAAIHASGEALGRQVKADEFIASGEKLAIRIKYSNDAPRAAEGWIVFALPEGCGLVSEIDTHGSWVSVDGGRSFGRLADLRVMQDGRVRRAAPKDVTHISRYLAGSLAPGAGGEVQVLATMR